MWLLTLVGADFTAPYPERFAFTPISAHNNLWPYVSGRLQGDMVAGLAPVATPKGLESELMGLPWDVSSCMVCVAFTSSLPMCSAFTPYPNHTSGCERDVHSRTVGSMAGFPWPGECSSISITLLMLSQETARGLMSLQTTHP